MLDWQKNPVLQGPENDYGDYDYLANPLPCDRDERKLTRYAVRCDTYTYDGYDSLDCRECIWCELGITRKAQKLKRKLTIFLK